MLMILSFQIHFEGNEGNCFLCLCTTCGCKKIVLIHVGRLRTPNQRHCRGKKCTLKNSVTVTFEVKDDIISRRCKIKDEMFSIFYGTLPSFTV